MSIVFKPDQTRYELEQKLGEGLNCVVWRAVRFDHYGLTRQAVALKLPKDQTSVPILRREFETLRRINSVYCARLIAWESSGDQAAIALEWIEGVTLFEFAERVLVSGLCARPNEVRDEIVRQIHLGLLDLRAAGVYHGDLHPKNVMLDREGRIRLIDFASGRTGDGHLQAMPGFLAPEIWAGGELGYESDVFALQVLRDHMLDGFRNLPSRAPALRRSLLPATENISAQKQIALHVERLTAPEFTTQVIAIQSPTPHSQTASARALQSSLQSRLRGKLHVELKLRRSRFIRASVVLSLALATTLSVRAEAPADQENGRASLQVRTSHWMQIEVNGRSVGFAPIFIDRLREGKHRITWQSSKGRGDMIVNLRTGETLRLIESRREPGQLEVH